MALLHALAPSHGRLLIYVWATDQDALSKRDVPSGSQDVHVPWVHQQPDGTTEGAPVMQRFYHLFAPGELIQLASAAAEDMGLHVGAPLSNARGVEIVHEGWERSNWYLEMRRWDST